MCFLIWIAKHERQDTTAEIEFVVTCKTWLDPLDPEADVALSKGPSVRPNLGKVRVVSCALQ
jgi:hypothetical protein